MIQYKEFQGKSLDDAIEEACAYFGVPREKLEIEILNDAKGGIFGLMGVKKATIRASRVQLNDSLTDLLGNATETRTEEKSDTKRPRTPSPVPEKAKTGRQRAPRDNAGKNAASGKADPAGERAPVKSKERKVVASTEMLATPFQVDPEKDLEVDSADKREQLPGFDLENGDLVLLTATVQNVMQQLVAPIVGDTPCEVEISGMRVRAVLDCGDAAGLLVGRDGQTLAAIQYLASRIIAKQLGASIRLQIDAGRYRERQDDKLRELALSLAEKARQSGRTQSTRPLSAYQRRIVHLALEKDAHVHTRSQGEGLQRRVLILLNRESAAKSEAHEEQEQGGPFSSS